MEYTVEKKPMEQTQIVHDQTFFSCGCFGGGVKQTTA